MPKAVRSTCVTEEPVKEARCRCPYRYRFGQHAGVGASARLALGAFLFVQGSIDWRQLDYIPLAGSFPVYQCKNSPQIIMTDLLNNSWSRDEGFTGRIGWIPKHGDEYVFSYINLKGQKGVPLYQGPNTAATFRNFWVWPYWNTHNYYSHSNTQIGESSSLKFRAFYDKFQNDIDMYSNDTYTVINTSNAEHSMYNEHNDGFSTEYDNRSLAHNVFSGSFFFKEGVHTKHGIYPGLSPFPLIEPVLRDTDFQTSIGVQDVTTLSSRATITGGFSADHFDGRQAKRMTRG